MGGRARQADHPEGKDKSYFGTDNSTLHSFGVIKPLITVGLCSSLIDNFFSVSLYDLHGLLSYRPIRQSACRAPIAPRSICYYSNLCSDQRGCCVRTWWRNRVQPQELGREEIRYLRCRSETVVKKIENMVGICPLVMRQVIYFKMYLRVNALILRT